MKKVSFSKWLLALMLVFVLVLAACNGDSDDGAEEAEDTDTTTEETEGTEEDEAEEATEEENDGIYSIEDFNTEKTSDGEPIEGGTLNFGLVSDTVFEGTLNYNFYSGAPDAEVIGWFDESLLAIDENYAYTQDGAATWEMSDDGTVFTFTIGDNVNWHDGEPVTAEDWAFAYEVLAHPDYDGQRYGNVSNVLGAPEYRDAEAEAETTHAAEAGTIEGLNIIDEKTLEMTFSSPSPSLIASGIWSYALPKHIFEEIPVAEMSESDAVRENPIGMGPFKVDTIVPGESVTYVKNEDYWRGEPNLDGVTLTVVSPQTVVQALETGEVDMVDSFPTDQYPDVEESLDNVEFLGDIDLAYTYIGFKLGSWDHDNNRVQMDPESSVADVNLRRAMWYAVDNDAVGKQFYNGLRWAGTTLIPPSHPDYHDETIEAPSYDPVEANRILDEAGYEYDGDYRTYPDGSELVLNFASMSGGDVAQPIANYYIQSWAEVGINVQLLEGQLLEFNAFYDRVGESGDDDPAIDIYQGAWGVGSDVDPTGLYGAEVMFNFPRYESEENTRLLEEGVSEAALDVEYRQEVYSEWQELMVEEIPVFPTLYRSVLVPVNDRVQNYSIAAGSGVYLKDLALTQEEPIQAGQAE